MIITCPNCETRFNVDPGRLLPNGRTVRCTKCGHLWSERPPDDMPRRVDAAPAPTAGHPSPGASAGDDANGRPPPQADAPAAAGRRLQPALAWAAVALVAVGLLAAGVVARERLQAWWPPSQALFELAGLAGNRAGVGLEIRNLVYRRENGGHTPALVVAGEVVNRSDRVIDVPKLRASLYDGREREIHTWFFAAKRDRLAPGEAVPIASSTRDSPSGVRRIEVRFAE